MLEAASAPFEGIKHRVLGIRLPGRVGFFTYKGLQALVDEFKPDLIYCEEEPYSLAAFQAAHAAKSCGAAFVFFSWENIQRRFKPPLNWVRKQVQGIASGAVAGNGEGMALYRSWGFSGPMALIPQYGVDTRLFKPFRSSRREIVAGYVGRLVKEKGPEIFMRGCYKARISGVIYGRGPEKNWLIKLDGLMGSDVDVKDFVPFERRHLIYRDFDVLVLPSLTTRKWKEQFGRVIIEAGACGVPTLGSNSGAIPEVVGNGGDIFPEGDILALAAQLKLLNSDPAVRKRLGRAARARAVKIYDERNLAARLGDFLNHVAQGRREN